MRKDSVYVDPKLLDDEPEPVGRITRPAEKLENSMPLALLVGVPGLLFLLDHFLPRGGSLNLNVVNFMFLFLAIVLHRTPRNLLTSLNEAIKGGAGIVIQFPFMRALWRSWCSRAWPRACRSGWSRLQPLTRCRSGRSSAPVS
ncbi:hypothetical protein HAALTHF_18800n [Vreelandella aquamarina]|nr:hypothetical protein HAALTHF_18800n [Halomonas axialensis]